MIKTKHQPERTCVGCRKKYPQNVLLAVKRLKDGTVRFDPQQVCEGRGGYLCRNQQCFEKVTKRKGKNAFEFWLKTEVPAEILAEIEKFIEKGTVK